MSTMKTLQKIKKVLSKEFAVFFLFFALVLVSSIVRERFLTANHPYRVCKYF